MAVIRLRRGSGDFTGGCGHPPRVTLGLVQVRSLRNCLSFSWAPGAWISETCPPIISHQTSLPKGAEPSQKGFLICFFILSKQTLLLVLVRCPHMSPAAPGCNILLRLSLVNTRRLSYLRVLFYSFFMFGKYLFLISLFSHFTPVITNVFLRYQW